MNIFSRIRLLFSDRKRREGAAYKVYVDDHFNYQNESQRNLAGGFDDLDSAIAKCCLIVDCALKKIHKPNMTAEELFRIYCMQGKNIRIENSDFSVWDYAKIKSGKICADKS